MDLFDRITHSFMVIFLVLGAAAIGGFIGSHMRPHVFLNGQEIKASPSHKIDIYVDSDMFIVNTDSNGLVHVVQLMRNPVIIDPKGWGGHAGDDVDKPNNNTDVMPARPPIVTAPSPTVTFPPN